MKSENITLYDCIIFGLKLIRMKKLMPDVILGLIKIIYYLSLLFYRQFI